MGLRDDDIKSSIISLLVLIAILIVCGYFVVRRNRDCERRGGYMPPYSSQCLKVETIPMEDE